jgi:hypothetical protein
MMRHGALSLLLHSKAKKILDLLVDLPFAWSIRPGELVKKCHGSRDVLA